MCIVLVNEDNILNNMNIIRTLPDVLIPFYVFCCCIVGVVFVFVALRQCHIWSRACQLHLDQLLDEYYAVKFKRYEIFIQSYLC